MKSSVQKNNIKGFALTEVLLAIAVIVIIGIAAYPLYKNARTSSEVESVANDIAILETNIQTLYSGQSSYAGIDPIQIESAGLVPDEIRTGALGQWRNPWGGTVSVLSKTIAGGATDNGFLIFVGSVPMDACVKLVNRVAPSFLTITGAADSDIIKPLNGKS